MLVSTEVTVFCVSLKCSRREKRATCFCMRSMANSSIKMMEKGDWIYATLTVIAASGTSLNAMMLFYVIKQSSSILVFLAPTKFHG